MLSSVHFHSFSNYGGLLSEAVAVLNGAHLGMNSRLCNLLKRHRHKAIEREENVYQSVLNELNVTSLHLQSVLSQNRSSVSSHNCHVTDVIHSIKRNPYLWTTRRHYSSSVKHRRHLPLLYHFRNLSDFHLMQLESRANSETDNPRAQFEYLKAVCETDPNYVIRRFESGRYAVNGEVRSVYQQAIQLTQKNAALSSIFDVSQGTTGTGYSGNKDNPLHVVVQPRRGGVLREIWYFARIVIIAFVITAFVSSSLFTQMKGGTQQMTKDYRPDMRDKQYTFEDVQGIDEAKAQVQEIVEFLKSPSKFKKLGAKLPTGMLLIGPPGTGKTLLAKAIAGEADVPFFFASGSEFDEMFVGIGAARVRKLFEQARRNKPCVLFIDELDAVGGARIASAIHPYSRMTLNQLLVELDGYNELEGVVVIGATNFPESLDKALIRPGRFDTQVNIPMPDIKARYNILKVHSKKVKLSHDVDLEKIARGTAGFSGADLANLINQSALKASSDGKNGVTTEDIEFARDKIIMGPERKSAVVDDESKKLVAYHEGGHAIVALYTPGAYPVYKATIMPRGPALGMVSMLPEKDEILLSKKQLMAKMDVAMGGRVAEEIIFGTENVTSGASSDFDAATRVATAMVTRFAMTETIGPVAYNDKEKVSSATQKLIEDEIKKLLKESHDRAYNILKAHSVEHKRLAEALLKYETLDLDEIKLVISGKPLQRRL